MPASPDIMIIDINYLDKTILQTLMLEFVSLIRLSDLCYQNFNTQHLMLANFDNNTIYLYKFDQ